jgi:hypothetical protein
MKHRLLAIGVILFFFGAVRAFATVAVSLDGGLEAVQDPDLRKQCGSRVSEVAMRTILQPQANFGSAAQPGMEIILSSDDPRGPQMSLFSDKLLQYLKTKRNHVLNVVFSHVGRGSSDDSSYELKLCLIEGKPLEYWVGSSR